jgi:hypothetical protein
MKKALVLIAAQLLAVTAFAASETPAPVEPLKMVTSNKGVAVYADKCSNGANASDYATVNEFIKKMESDKNSKLYAIEQRAMKSRNEEAYVWTSAPTLASHIRMGCSDSYNKLIATLSTQLKTTNAHEMETQYIIVIKDTVEADVRTLELIDVKAFPVNSEYK